jgi:hypothetical protein
MHENFRLKNKIATLIIVLCFYSFFTNAQELKPGSIARTVNVSFTVNKGKSGDGLIVMNSKNVLFNKIPKVSPTKITLVAHHDNAGMLKSFRQVFTD